MSTRASPRRLQDHPDNDELKAAVVLEANPKKVVAMLESGESITVTGDGLKPARSGPGRRRATRRHRSGRGAVIRLVQDAKDDWSITQLPEVEGAFVSLDPRTGAVRTMVGGFDYSKSKFNHVTQAWRQPGSSFKPFIYSAALEKGFTPATVINDAPLFFDAGATGSQPWEPKNYDGTFDGPMSMRNGAGEVEEHDLDPDPQVDRPGYAQDWVTRFGFDAEKHPAYLTMALGAGSVTPLQMAIGLRRVRQRRLPRQSGADQPHHRFEGPHSQRSQAAGTGRVDAHDRRAQRLRDDQPSAERHPHRHRGSARARAQPPGHLRQDRHDQ